MVGVAVGCSVAGGVAGSVGAILGATAGAVGFGFVAWVPLLPLVFDTTWEIPDWRALVPFERATPVADWMPRIDPMPMRKMMAVPPIAIQAFRLQRDLWGACRASARPPEGRPSGRGVLETLPEVARTLLLAVSGAICGRVVRATLVTRLGMTRLICLWLFSSEARNRGSAMAEIMLRIKAPTTVPARPKCPPMTDATAAAPPPAMTWVGLRPRPFPVWAAPSAGSSVSLLPVFVICCSFVRSASSASTCP